MATTFTAVVQQEGQWWIGWIEEVPGVNGQGKTKKQCLDSLRSALKEALEMNRKEALGNAKAPYEEVAIQL